MSVLAFWAIVSVTKHPDNSGSGILMNAEWGLCALWIGNQRPVLRSHDQWGPIIGQGPDTTVKLPHDTQKGQPNAIPKISMLSLLSITAQLSFHASVTDHFHHLSKIISQFIPVDGVLARVNKEHTGHIWPPDTNWGSPDWKLSHLFFLTLGKLSAVS